MRVLVTGSSGQLGMEVCRQLSEAHTIIGLDIIPGPFTQVLGPVEDRALAFEQVSRVDAVVHIASLHAPQQELLPKARFVDVNVQGVLHLLEAAVAHGCQRFVYTSTTSVYGRAMEPRGDCAVWVTEELIPEPRDIYDVTKLAAEQLCRLIHQEHGLPVIILRTSRFYPQPYEALAIHRLHRGLDVRDCAWAHQLALESQVPFGLYNVSARSPFQREEHKVYIPGLKTGRHADILMSSCLPPSNHWKSAPPRVSSRRLETKHGCGSSRCSPTGSCASATSSQPSG